MLNKITDLGISKIEAETLINSSKNIKKDYKKLKKGYPIQYLIGHVNFYGYKINVNKNVLIPRFETETLIENLFNYIEKYNINNPKILDLCTGSGCIAITLSKELNINITASDISKKALKKALENQELNQAKIKFIKSNLFKNINEKFDIIISNPPYISKTEKISKIVKHEPKKALYSSDKGTYLIKKIIKESKKYLNYKSIIAIEIGDKQGEMLKQYAKKKYNDSLIEVKRDLNNRERYLFIINNCE